MFSRAWSFSSVSSYLPTNLLGFTLATTNPQSPAISQKSAAQKLSDVDALPKLRLVILLCVAMVRYAFGLRSVLLTYSRCPTASQANSSRCSSMHRSSILSSLSPYILGTRRSCNRWWLAYPGVLEPVTLSTSRNCFLEQDEHHTSGSQGPQAQEDACRREASQASFSAARRRRQQRFRL